MILEHPDLELVGAYTHSADKVGRDAGELAGVAERTGVLATADVAQLLSVEADCIAYFANSANRDAGMVAETVPFLERGVNVSSISHFDIQYPLYGRPEFVRPLEEACNKGNSSIYLTGDDPGWAFGHVLFSLLSVVGTIERIDVGALTSVKDYAAIESLRMYGFNEDLAYRPPMFTSEVGAMWHINTLRGIADFLGVEVDEYQQEWHTAAVDFDFESAAYGVVKAGKTAGTYWTVSAIVGGRPFLVYHKLLRLHEAAGPDWPKSAKGTGRENAKLIRITGDPNLEMEIVRESRSRSLTPVSAVTAIPWVCDARPGILTQVDVPLFPARALILGK